MAREIDGRHPRGVQLDNEISLIYTTSLARTRKSLDNVSRHRVGETSANNVLARVDDPNGRSPRRPLKLLVERSDLRTLAANRKSLQSRRALVRQPPRWHGRAVQRQEVDVDRRRAVQGIVLSPGRAERQ